MYRSSPCRSTLPTMLSRSRHVCKTSQSNPTLRQDTKCKKMRLVTGSLTRLSAKTPKEKEADKKMKSVSSFWRCWRSKAAAHVSFVSCCIMFSSSLFFIYVHLLLIFVSLFIPLFIPVFLMHVLVLIIFKGVFIFSCVLTLFISPVVFHVCFIERRENKWTMKNNIIYTKWLRTNSRM